MNPAHGLFKNRIPSSRMMTIPRIEKGSIIPNYSYQPTIIYQLYIYIYYIVPIVLIFLKPIFGAKISEPR